MDNRELIPINKWCCWITTVVYVPAQSYGAAQYAPAVTPAATPVLPTTQAAALPGGPHQPQKEGEIRSFRVVVKINWAQFPESREVLWTVWLTAKSKSITNFFDYKNITRNTFFRTRRMQSFYLPSSSRVWW